MIKSLELPSDQEILDWIKELNGFGEGNLVFPGVRQAGSPADDRATRWLLSKLQGFGLQDVRREAVHMIGWQPTEYGLAVSDQTFDCWPIFYARFLERSAVTAGMVYVGAGSPADFEAADIADKIVVADMISPLIPLLRYDHLKAEALETYDPGDTLPPDKGARHWHFTNQDAYHLAAAGGAAGFVGINVQKSDAHRFYHNASGVGADPRKGVLGPLPGLYVSNATGEALRPLAIGGAVATLVSAGETPWTETYNVVGVLPGESSAVIQISSHSDGGAVNDGTGAAEVLALAKAYSPRASSGGRTAKTLRFLLTGGHFASIAGKLGYIKKHADDLRRDTVMNLTIEHVGKQCRLENGELVDSGLVWPRALFVSDSALYPILSDAVRSNDLQRSFIFPASSAIAQGSGEGWSWHVYGEIPSIWHITGVQYMQSTADTLEKVAVSELAKVATVFATLVDELAVCRGKHFSSK